MGFHKRFITEDGAKAVYARDGAEGVYEWLASPDALITVDDVAARIVDIYNDRSIGRKEAIEEIDYVLEHLTIS